MQPELCFLNQMTDFQREVVSALKEMGYKWKYFTDYTYISDKGGSIKINVADIKTVKDLITIFYNEGLDQKRFEIQRVLGI